MNKVKIAVLDSGMAREISDTRIVYGRQFYWDHFEERIRINNDITDYNGHGTACVETILNICPQAEIYVIKMLGISGRTSKKILIKAIKHALELSVNVIVVAANVLDENECDEIKKICLQIQKYNLVMLVAVQNGKNRSAIFNDKNIIGVIGAVDLVAPFCFCVNEDVQMVCNSSPIIIRGRKGMWQIFQGNSKATAMAAGHVANYLLMNELQVSGLYENLDSATKMMMLQQINRTHIKKKSFSKKREAFYANNDLQYQKFIYLLCECINCSDVKMIRQSDLLRYQNGIWMKNIDSFLDLLKDKLDVKLDMINVTDLTWAYQFYEKYIIKDREN